MSMAFAASQKAHDEGDGERAKELSELGKAHQARMHELHAEAASQVFKGEFRIMFIGGGSGSNDVYAYFQRRTKGAHLTRSTFMVSI